MLQVWNNIKAEQIPVESLDLIAAILQLPDKTVLVVSVYIEENNKEALISTTRLLYSLVVDIYRRDRKQTDVLIMGDFNRYN